MEKRTTVHLIVLLLLMVVTSGCAPKKIGDGDFVLGPIRLNMPLDEVVSALGPPAKEEPHVDGDRYQYVISASVRLTIALDSDGVCSVWLEQPVDGVLPFSGWEAAPGNPVGLGEDKLATPRSISIGSEISEVIRQYGHPNSDWPSETQRLVQYCLDGEYPFLNFQGVDGRVVAIVFSRVTWSDD